MKVIIFCFCNFEVLRFILVLENKCYCSPHKSALSCFCCIFCTLSWTFMSLPVSRGVCSQFVSYLVQLVSLLYIYSIYIIPSVAIVLCDLLNVMFVCLPLGFGLLFVLVVLWNACTEMLAYACFPQLLNNVTDFDWHVSFTSASLSLYLV